jgi:hypothetical protein
LKGGGRNEKIIPMYKPLEIPNDPFVPKEQKQMEATRVQKEKEKEQKPIINFQYYQPPPKPKEKQMFEQVMMPPMIPGYPGYPYPQMVQQPVMASAYQNVPLPTPPIVNKYEITMGGPTADHAAMSIVYEDMVPNKINPNYDVYTSVAERQVMNDFARSRIFNNVDGANIDLSSTSSNSLTARIKINKLNPYNNTLDAYYQLPHDFLIYASCYPIRRDSRTHRITCAAGSSGVNVRIYKLTEEAFNARIKQTGENPMDTIFSYDVWRDLAYYEFIRSEIISKKQCPNFINLYGYFISLKSNINFEETNKMLDRKMGFNKGNANVTNDLLVVGSVGEIVDQKTARRILEVQNNPTNVIKLELPKIENMLGISEAPTKEDVKKIQDGIAYSSSKYAGKALVVVTEAPIYSFYEWCGAEYQDQGNVRTQTRNGVHNELIWYNVLFQLVAGLYCMQKNGIYMRNFTLKKNVYIKELDTKSTPTCWKYVIDGVQYYVPNYNYLVMIDTNYQDSEDLTKPTTLLEGQTAKVMHKIEGRCVDDKIDPARIKEKSFEMFKAVMNSNNLTQGENGITVPSSIKTLVGKISGLINSNPTNTDIKSYIHEYLSAYVNNRVGTVRRTDEPEGDILDGSVKVGDIVMANNEKEYHVYLGISLRNLHKFLKSSKNDLITERYIVVEKPLTDFRKYTGVLPQTIKPGQPSLSEDDLIETYIL